MDLMLRSPLLFPHSAPLQPEPSSLSSRGSPTNSFGISIPATNPMQPRSRCNRLSLRAKATVAVDSPATDGGSRRSGPPKVLLEVKDLRAVIAKSREEILRGVNLTINDGEVHAIMGKNGSGKSTFSKVLVGHPDYEVIGGTVVFKGENLLDMEPEERSHAGLFMSFQTPVEIPGVCTLDFLLMAFNARKKYRGETELPPLEFNGFLSRKIAAVNMSQSIISREVNKGSSGGEKKRNEILQLAVLEPELAILDEIDSGLDVDALQDVARVVNGLRTPQKSILIITHYQRLLDYIRPSYVHIMDDGLIVKTGDISLAEQIEEEGYTAIAAAQR